MVIDVEIQRDLSASSPITVTQQLMFVAWNERREARLTYFFRILLKLLGCFCFWVKTTNMQWLCVPCTGPADLRATQRVPQQISARPEPSPAIVQSIILCYVFIKSQYDFIVVESTDSCFYNKNCVEKPEMNRLACTLTKDLGLIKYTDKLLFCYQGFQ